MALSPQDIALFDVYITSPVDKDDPASTPLNHARRALDAGFSRLEAATLAANPHLSVGDIELACTLVAERGCPPLTALRIVWGP